MIEDYLKYGKLYDFYGNLLSDSQKNTIELYYLEDFSINEIGEELGISKQTVFETLKRAERKLESYEETLGLIERFENEKRLIPKLYETFKELKKDMEKMEKLLKEVREVEHDF